MSMYDGLTKATGKDELYRILRVANNAEVCCVHTSIEQPIKYVVGFLSDKSDDMNGPTPRLDYWIANIDLKRPHWHLAGVSALYGSIGLLAPRCRPRCAQALYRRMSFGFAYRDSSTQAILMEALPAANIPAIPICVHCLTILFQEKLQDPNGGTFLCISDSPMEEDSTYHGGVDIASSPLTGAPKYGNQRIDCASAVHSVGTGPGGKKWML